MKELDLSHNLLRSVPHLLVNCQALKILTLSHNLISEFSIAFIKLPTLEYLYLAFNEVTILPDDPAWKGCNLKVLDLESNSIYEVPSVILRDSKIHNLNLKDNHIERKQLQMIEGFGEYEERRKIKMDVVVNNHLDANFGNM